MRIYVPTAFLTLNICYAAVQAIIASSSPITVTNDVPQGASQIIKDAFISFAIEFSNFPSFAGNTSSPNTFSDNLLNNIGNLTGVKPYIRVGGNSQDHALYDPDTTEAVIPKTNGDPTIFIGKSFFESYSTWPNAKFSHGFDLGLVTSDSGWASLVATIPLACNALRDKLVAWEYGNEPDLYTTNQLRPAGWGVAQYVSEWQNGTRQIQSSIAQSCPDMVNAGVYGYIGLSLWGDVGGLDPTAVWNDLKTDKSIKMVSFHNYMAGAGSAGLTLQSTLLNHTHTTASVRQHLDEYASIIGSEAPIIVGEANSVFNIGVPTISDTFGAALWTLDYNLWCASQNITRVHMQQGVNFYYNAWQPIDTPAMAKGTKAPYYGSIAAASAIGNALDSKVRITHIPLRSTTDVAYGAYVNGELSQITVLNMRAYNSTSSGTRPSQTHVFSIPGIKSTSAAVKTLWAGGSDVLTGITFDGYSYDYSLDQGKPVLLSNVTRGTTLPVSNGMVTVEVMDSSAVILQFV